MEISRFLGEEVSATSNQESNQVHRLREELDNIEKYKEFEEYVSRYRDVEYASDELMGISEDSVELLSSLESMKYSKTPGNGITAAMISSRVNRLRSRVGLHNSIKFDHSLETNHSKEVIIDYTIESLDDVAGRVVKGFLKMLKAIFNYMVGFFKKLTSMFNKDKIDIVVAEELIKEIKTLPHPASNQLTFASLDGYKELYRHFLYKSVMVDPFKSYERLISFAESRLDVANSRLKDQLNSLDKVNYAGTTSSATETSGTSIQKFEETIDDDQKQVMHELSLSPSIRTDISAKYRLGDKNKAQFYFFETYKPLGEFIFVSLSEPLHENVAGSQDGLSETKNPEEFYLYKNAGYIIPQLTKERDYEALAKETLLSPIVTTATDVELPKLISRTKKLVEDLHETATILKKKADMVIDKNILALSKVKKQPIRDDERSAMLTNIDAHKRHANNIRTECDLLLSIATTITVSGKVLKDYSKNVLDAYQASAK